MSSTLETALEKAAKIMGGTASLATALNVTTMTISHWKRRGIPAERAVQIEKVTNRKVKKSELRPDLFGRVSKVVTEVARA